MPIVWAVEYNLLIASADGAAFAPLLGASAIDRVEARLLPATLLTLIFSLIAVRLRSVTLDGAIAGSAVSILLYLGSEAAGFMTLATVFVLTAVATRIGYSRKQRIGAAENRKGRRASQVLANLGFAATLSVVGLFWENHLWVVVAMVAALAEAAADTVSSECGQAWSDRVYLVSSFRRVAVGTNGGVSLPGTVAGVGAAFIVAAVAWGVHLVSGHGAVLAATAAALGMFADSLLGATLERPRRLGNNVVNFLSTSIASLVAAAFMQ